MIKIFFESKKIKISEIVIDYKVKKVFENTYVSLFIQLDINTFDSVFIYFL